MNGTEIVAHRTGQRRRLRLTLGALLALAATLATTTVVASPASAAAVCGNRVRVRNTIYYKACNAPGSEAGSIRTATLFRNDHGSEVGIWFQEAFKRDGHLIGYGWTRIILPEGDWRPRDLEWPCDTGEYLSYALRVQENDGTPGPWSVAPAIRCP